LDHLRHAQSEGADVGTHVHRDVARPQQLAEDVDLALAILAIDVERSADVGIVLQVHEPAMAAVLDLACISCNELARVRISDV
jgi:hypothetical protein